jgi:hypothetical protein
MHALMSIPFQLFFTRILSSQNDKHASSERTKEAGFSTEETAESGSAEKIQYVYLERVLSNISDADTGERQKRHLELLEGLTGFGARRQCSLGALICSFILTDGP